MKDPILELTFNYKNAEKITKTAEEFFSDPKVMRYVNSFGSGLRKGESKRHMRLGQQPE